MDIASRYMTALVPMKARSIRDVFMIALEAISATNVTESSMTDQALTSDTKDEKFYDRSGSYIGYISGNNVYNRSGSLIGRVSRVPNLVSAIVYFYGYYPLR